MSGNTTSPGAIFRYVMLIRMLRVLRIFTNVSAFRSISQVRCGVAPQSQSESETRRTLLVHQLSPVPAI
eukprot:SAG22_NODE_223_length_14745_cov_16.175065_4_plen_69_part_00